MSFQFGQKKVFRRAGVSDSADLKRIMNLPRRYWPDEIGDLVEVLTEAYKTPQGTQTLWPIQAITLAELHDYGGATGFIRTSGGKTLTSFLAPLVMDAKRPLIIVPGALEEVTKRKWTILSEHWQLPEVYIFTYNKLSMAAYKNFLHEYQPDIIIPDEAHKFKNLQAACTKHLHWYLNDFPDTIFVPLTGTPTTRQLNDYAHIVRWSSPKLCPVPRSYGVTVEWGLCLDEIKSDTRSLGPGHLIKLCNDRELELLKTNPLSAVRSAFQRRLTETPGIIVLADKGVTTPLVIRALDVDIDSEEINDAFKMLRLKWCTPDGRAFAEAVRLWAYCRQLVCGFYYRWFSVDRFRACLGSHLAQHTGSSIEQKILRYYANATVFDADLVKAVETLRSSVSGGSSTIYGSSTDSHTNNTRNSLPNMRVCATSAEAEKLWQSIIATRQGKSEESCVTGATGVLDALRTLLNTYPLLLRIFAEATKCAEPPKAWLRARTAWLRVVRHIIHHNQRRLASEYQIALAFQRGEYKYGEYADWLAIRDTFKPNPVPFWVHEHTLVLAEEWMAKNPRGIVWSDQKAFSQRLAQRTGRPFFGSKGQDARGNAIEDASGPIIAAVGSNKEGRDLQHNWDTNLVISAAPNGTVWEQMLARTHREGQKAKEVRVDVLLGCSESVYGFRQAIRDAVYQQEVMGYPQKLIWADIEGLLSDESLSRKKAMRWRRGIKK